jgi:hypothetical protein
VFDHWNMRGAGDGVKQPAQQKSARPGGRRELISSQLSGNTIGRGSEGLLEVAAGCFSEYFSGTLAGSFLTGLRPV